jgi:DNA-binding PadR family transcriptional regulator
MEMEDLGEIEEERTSESGERGKRIYRITSKGEESLKEWETRKRELRDKAFKWRAFWRELYEPNLRESTDEVETSISGLNKALPGAKDLDAKERHELQNRLSSTKQELEKIIHELQSEKGPDR